MYLATVAWDTWMPTLRSSPRIRGVPRRDWPYPSSESARESPDTPRVYQEYAPSFPGPIETESFAMPGDDRFGLHNQQHRTPLRSGAGEPNPKQSVHGVQTKPAALRPLQNSYLVAESQDLDLQQGTSAKPGADTNDHGKESSQHEGTLAQSSLSSMISV